MADIFNIAGEINSTSQEGTAVHANQVKDDLKNKKQSQINEEVGEELELHTNRLNALTGQNYVTVVATQSTTVADIQTLINATGEGEQVDTIYRVGFWDGSAYVADKYTEYAWNGTAYVILDVKSSIGEVFDISQYNAVGGTPTAYADLTAALGTDGANIPADIRRGGMSIKFIQGNAQSSDNKYVQFRYMPSDAATAATFTNTANWQGVDATSTAGSHNLVESGGVYQGLIDVGFDVNIEQGGLQSNTGTTHAASNRVRTDIFLKAPIKVETSGNYLSRRFEYNLDGTYIGYSSNWVTKDVVTDTTKIYRFAFENNESTDITPTDAKPYINIYNGLKYNINYIGENALRADLEQVFSTQEKTRLQSNIGLEARLASLNDNLIYIRDLSSANIHNSATPTPATSPEPTDGSDWAGHNISTGGVPGTSASYNLTYYIPVQYGTDYKCTQRIRRLCFFDENGDFVSPSLESILAEAAIVVPPTAKTCRFMYEAGFTPDSVRFGRYQDDINVPYSSEKIDYDVLNRRIALYDETELREQKIVTSVASSGFDVNCGGQYCLTETQKQTYDVTSDLCATRVVQKLLGYDKANVCAYSGVPASLIFFKNGSSPLILKNSVTLISGTAVAYTFDTTTISAPMTQNLSVLETSDIGTFSGILNGYNVTVNSVSGTITLNDTAPANVIIPAGAMLYRNVYTRTTAGSSTITNGLKGSTGLILQIGANSEGDTPEEIFNYCELAIKESGCKWFVVLRQNTQGNLDYDTADTTGSSDLNKASKLLRTKYGSMFLDHMAYMTSRKSLTDQGITPTTSAQYPDENGQNSNPLTQQQIDHDVPCDMECIATRRVPSSFWYGAWRADDVPTNEGHFNAQGLECLGKYIYTMVHRMGF